MPSSKFQAKQWTSRSVPDCQAQQVTSRLFYLISVYCIVLCIRELILFGWFNDTGPSTRVQADADTLQAARRVVTVVPNSKAINNNNHISSGGRTSRSSVGGPVRNAPPRPTNPAPTVPNAAVTRGATPSGVHPLKKNPSMNRSVRAHAPPPSGPPPVNQPVVRPSASAANNPSTTAPPGGFRLPNPGAGFRLPPINQGKAEILYLTARWRNYWTIYIAFYKVMKWRMASCVFSIL